MANESKAIPGLSELLTMLGQRGHTYYVVLYAAWLSDETASLLKAHMPNLTHTKEDSLFKGYGPLSSAEARIEFCYALGLIPNWLRQDLNVFRNLRNKFAHPPKGWSLDDLWLGSDRTMEIMKRFKNYASLPLDPLAALMRQYEICVEEMSKKRNTLMVAAALRSPDAAVPSSALLGTLPEPPPPPKAPSRGGKSKGKKAPPRSSQA